MGCSGLTAVLVAGVLTPIIWWFGYPLTLPLSWVIAITVITFLAFGNDKRIAGSGRTRTSEKALLFLTFIGGTLGAATGMVFFHHKTSKRSFLFKFCLVVFVQIVLALIYYSVAQP